MQHPERQIVPPGAIDLADVKSQREQAIVAEELKYFAERDQLAALMAPLFSVPELPTAMLMALLDVLETGGVDRLDAIADIAKTVEFLRKVAEHEQKAEGGTSR